MLLRAGDTTCWSTGSLSRHVCSNRLSREKGDVCSIEVCQGNWGRISFWHQETHLFIHMRIVFPVRGSPGNCYFCIYFISCLFHFDFFMLLYFFYFLSNPHTFNSCKTLDFHVKASHGDLKSYVEVEGGSLQGVIAKVLDCGLVVIPLGKAWNPYPPSLRINSIIAVLLQGWLKH